MSFAEFAILKAMDLNQYTATQAVYKYLLDSSEYSFTEKCGSEQDFIDYINEGYHNAYQPDSSQYNFTEKGWVEKNLDRMLGNDNIIQESE